MSKLTKAIRRLSPLRALESGVVPFRGEDGKALDTLLTQTENDRRQISQLNAKNAERARQLKNQSIRLGQLHDQAEADTQTIAALRTELAAARGAIASTAADRNYWQGEARRLEAELTELRKQTPVGPWMTVASHEAILEARLEEQRQASRIENDHDHRAHVEFHEKAESVMGRLSFPQPETEARDKLARIAEIIGTTDVPEKTIRNYASIGTTAAQLLSELLAAKVEAVAGILDED